MANHKSAEKRNRQSEARRERNKSAKSRARTAIKKLRLAIDEQNKEEAGKLLTDVQSLLGKLSKSGAMKAKTSSRKTSRLACQVSKL